MTSNAHALAKELIVLMRQLGTTTLDVVQRHLSEFDPGLVEEVLDRAVAERRVLLMLDDRYRIADSELGTMVDGEGIVDQALASRTPLELVWGSMAPHLSGDSGIVISLPNPGKSAFAHALLAGHGPRGVKSRRRRSTRSLPSNGEAT